jgi:hypothetical protein
LGDDLLVLFKLLGFLLRPNRIWISFSLKIVVMGCIFICRIGWLENKGAGLRAVVFISTV